MDETRSLLTRRDGQPALEIQRPVLVVLEGTEVGRQLILPEGPVVLGRGAEAELRLEDPSASRRHARLVPEGDAWRVEDLGSKLGTLVDEVRVETALLRPGGTLQVGRTRLRLERTTLVLLATRPEAARLGALVGASESMRDLFGLIHQVAPLDLPVVIHGETGTGKEGIARALHQESRRAAGPYVVVDCTLLTGEHLRSELFGHTRGAFTGAEGTRQGAFERAHQGTLFLDEIGELPLDLQPALLRVLQEGEVRPLGSDQPRKVDVRVVAASHRDMAARVRAGALRQDLFYRLAAVELEVPPLRQRPEDIEALAVHFLPPGSRLGPGTAEALAAHPWPGNVRELEQAIRVAVALAGGGPLEPAHLQLRAPQGAAPVSPATPVSRASPPARSRAEFEEATLRQALEDAKHHRGKAAKSLGIARSTLYERMKKYGIE